VLEPILPCLLPTELKFDVAILALAMSIYYVVECDFVFICAPGARQNGLGWNVGDQIFRQAKLTRLPEFQKAHVFITRFGGCIDSAVRVEGRLRQRRVRDRFLVFGSV
jgi:hypothetical protein